jgi:group II intron reverse transcriptase/maturase
MRNADTVLAIHRDRGSRGLPLERVYKHLFDPEFFLRAYGKIYRNAGAMTKGTTKETVDGMSLQKIHNIIELLRQERYAWKPARRVMIPKANGKKRPLGIPAWSDKLVQEVLRMLLEPYYEQRFSDHSHGFRPERGCHTALREIPRTWRGTTWFIEGDIKGCFDNIDHTILLEIIRRDIHDGRVVTLIGNLLKAGYLQDWNYHDNASGTPQGGIVSPLLANIYRDQLDKFVVDTLKPAYTKGKHRRDNPEYVRVIRQLRRARDNDDGAAIKRLKREQRELSSHDPMDLGYRRLRYIRYADDFLRGFAGPKKEAEAIRDRLAEFLREDLKLELSVEKTLVTHAATEKAKFPGYELTTTRSNALVAASGKRNANGNIALLMPRKAVEKILGQYGRKGKITRRPELLPEDDYTIILRYQSVLKGLYNFYCMATNVSRRMNRIKYTLEVSLTKTLAYQHRLTVNQVYKKYRAINHVDNLLMLQIIIERRDKEPLIATFGGFPIRRKPEGLGTHDFQFQEAWYAPSGGSRSEVVERLLRGKCERCDAEGPLVRIVMHHVRALKDLERPGRTPKAPGQKTRSARKRKSRAVCEECHKAIHAGRYDGPSPARLTGEPDAAKVASPVRGGAVGTGADR